MLDIAARIEDNLDKWIEFDVLNALVRLVESGQTDRRRHMSADAQSAQQSAAIVCTLRRSALPLYLIYDTISMLQLSNYYLIIRM